MLHATWHFQPTPDNCRATVQAGRVTLAISAGHAGPIRLVLSQPAPEAGPLAPGTRVQLRFTGPAGTWQISGAATRDNAAVFSFGAGEDALSRLLIMLSGGTIDPEAPGLPLISLPASNADGTIWFTCVRHALS